MVTACAGAAEAAWDGTGVRLRAGAGQAAVLHPRVRLRAVHCRSGSPWPPRLGDAGLGLIWCGFSLVWVTLVWFSLVWFAVCCHLAACQAIMRVDEELG